MIVQCSSKVEGSASGQSSIGWLTSADSHENVFLSCSPLFGDGISARSIFQHRFPASAVASEVLHFRISSWFGVLASSHLPVASDRVIT